MAASGLFRLTKRFEEGYNKEDVMAYVNDLLEKNADYEKQIQENESSAGVDTSVVNKLEDEIKTLKAQLDASNIQVQKQESLLSSEKSVREKLQKQFAEEKQRLSAELARASSDNGEAETLIEQIKARDEEIESLVEKIRNLENEVSEKENTIIQKETEIAKLNSEITELKENSENGVQSTLDIQKVFIEAKNTMNKLTADSKKKAEETIEEANQKSEKIINEANEIADKTIAEANEKAQKTIAEADEKAVRNIENSEKEAENKLVAINEKVMALDKMGEDMKKFLISDIKEMSSDIAKVLDFINQISSTVQKKVENAQSKLDNADKSIKEDKMINDIIEKIHKDYDFSDKIKVKISETNETDNAEILPEENLSDKDDDMLSADVSGGSIQEDDDEYTPDNVLQLEDLDDNFKLPDISAIKKKAENKSEVPPVKNTKFSPQDWGIDLDALTKEIEEEESKKQEIEEE